MLNRSIHRDNACSQGAMKTKSQISEISENPRWHHIYFVLAGFNVVVAIATLLVSAIIFEIYVSSIDEHSAWAKRAGAIYDLSQALVRVNTLGHDIVASNNPGQGKSNLQQHHTVFSDLYRDIESEFETLADKKLSADLLINLREVKASEASIVSDATAIFHLNSLGDRTNVGLRMVMMEQHFARSSAALAATHTIIRNRQSLILNREGLSAKSLQNYEYFIVGIIFLMIVIVVSYGYHLVKRMRSNDNRLEDILAQNRGIIDTAGDGIITISHAGIVGTFNPASERIFGYKKEEVVDKNVTLLMNTLDSHQHMDYLAKYFATGDATVLGDGRVVEGRKKDGTLFSLHLSVSPMKLRSTDTVTFVGSLRDLTEQKRLQAELVSSMEEAKQSAHAKSEFLASMSHEIRTPMNGVLGMLGLLLKSELTADQKRKAQIAQSSGEALLSIINDILDFSKVEAGKLELEELDFNLKLHLGDFAKSMAVRTQEKGLDLILDVSDIDETMVSGDPGRVRQILTNLVGNAIKFTNTGEIIVRAGLKDIGEQGLLLYCSVTDTGVGIPQDKQSTLFELFSQVDASTTRKYGGTGLGLSIVKQLCELMNGSFSVVSEVGNGSCFEFTVLLGKNQQLAQKLPTIDISDMSILLVDDNTSNRNVIKNQLVRWGADVVDTQSSAVALQLLDQHNTRHNPLLKPFAAAFIDMDMPVTGGLTLGIAIQQDGRFNDVRLSLMTPMAAAGNADFYAEFGFRFHFPKPTTTVDLDAALSAMFATADEIDVAESGQTHQCIQDSHARDHSIQGARVLLVEDNTVNQEVALDILLDMGITADVAANGLEALHCLKQRQTLEPYQVILMDCQMPEMDGYETTRCIRAGDVGSQFKQIPIIAMTANAMKEDRGICIAAGMSDYLSKPVVPDDLEKKLRQWLAQDTSHLADIPGTPEVTTQKAPAKVTTDVVDAASDELLQLPIWDRQALFVRVREKQERVTKLVTLAASTMPETIEALSLAVANREYDAVSAAAHSIKGLAANLSGLRVQSMANQIELAVKLGEEDKVATLLPHFLIHCDELMEQFSGAIEHAKTQPPTDTI
jgi:PAS domain S-box-containing protein